MINVVFTNGSQSTTLQFVRNIQWGSEFSEDSLVDETTQVGQRRREVVVNGFVNKAMFSENVAAQQQIESDLIAVGKGDIQITGMTDITDCRFVSLQFREYRGNPVAEFDITFITESANVFAHEPVKIGSLTLSPANGYDYADVVDSIEVQGSDEQLVNNKNRRFTISGMFVGNTLDDINTNQAALVAEIENKNTLVITLSSAVGGFAGLYTVRPGKIEFGSPKLREQQQSRSFLFECSTYEDYSKEPYTLGETPQSFDGIQLDVVTGIEHKRENEKQATGPTFPITSEELIVNGKKYFANWTAYTAFRDSLNPIPVNTYTINSTTGAVLELVTATVGEFERDGNDLTNAKRYSASVSLTFKWDIGLEGNVYEYAPTRFGVGFYNITNTSFNSTVDSFGNVTSRGVSVSGQVVGANLSVLKAKVGTLVNYDATLPNVYVTSVTINSTHTQNLGGTAVTVYDVSVSAQQLDTASQAVSFIRSLFRMSRAGATGTSYVSETIQFEAVSSLNKSIANRWDAQNQKFKVTSVTLSVSGEVWETDSGGNPANPNKMIDLLNKIDALLSAELSVQGSANTVPGGETLPSNTDIHYMLSNISVGGWTSFTKQVGTGAGTRYWRQTVSLTATAVFDLTGSSNTQPDFVDSKSFVYTDEAPKFQQIQILGFGTVFKRVGTIQAKEVVTVQRQFKDKTTFVAGQYPSLTTTPVLLTSGSPIKGKETEENRGLVNRKVVEWVATEKL